MCKGLGKIQEGILEFLADGKWVSTKDVQDVCKCAYEYQERQIFRSLTRLVAAGKVEKRWGSYDCEAGYCRMDNCDKSSVLVRPRLIRWVLLGALVGPQAVGRASARPKRATDQ